MSNEPRADSALRALRELVVPVAPFHAEARRRRRVVERLQRLAGEAPRPRHRWLRLSVAAVALCALGVLGLQRWWGLSADSPAPKVVSGERGQPKEPRAAGERQVASGAEVETDAGSSVRLRTALGARISVAGSSQLRLADGKQAEDERVELSRGSIRVKVPKLGPHRQFRVNTPDTLVIVHGTEFSVAVHADGHGRTNTLVEVTSGRVEVRKKQVTEFLGAGTTWSSRRKREGAEHEGAASAASTTASNATPRPPAAAREAREAAGGRLARANALLTSALEAVRRGNDEVALARLDELLRRYPDSALADNARVERFRALLRLGREQEASRAAAGYLEGEPDGFARDEARELGK